MGELVQSIFLSDFTIFILVSATGLAVTGWAISKREFTGYILGWLAGIFFILLFSTIIPEASSDEEGMTSTSVNFLTVFMPGFLGVVMGFGVPAAMQTTQISSHRIVRALSIAGIMSVLISSGYLMLVAAETIRVMLAVFVLAITIGVLLHSILSRQQRFRSQAIESNGASLPVNQPEVSVTDQIRERRRFQTRQRFNDN